MSLLHDLRNLFQKDKQPPVTTLEANAEIPAPVIPKTPHQDIPDKVKLAPAAGGTIVRQVEEQQPSQNEILAEIDWSVKTAKTFRTGELIENRYKVEEVLSGAMGYVYIGRDTRQQITFAIKQPKESMLADRDLFSRVLQEADSWTGLGMHPNIAYCYFVKQIEDVPHIFIEYVDGGSLEEWISDRRCADYKVGIDMAIQFCHGLERAHNRGMIHRDIKPRNILVTKEGLVKVTDFGIAGGGKVGGKVGSISGDQQGTRMGEMMGTLAYMSPEQFKDPRQKSAEAPEGVWYESDVYSFGVCIWEMFCGRRPREISIGVMGDTPDPNSLRRDFPAGLRTLLLGSVDLDREKRPQDFSELREKLNGIYRELYGSDAPHYRLELHDTTADELNNQGYSYYELGKKEEARKCFEAAVEVNSTHPEAVFNLALLQWRSGEIDDMVVLRRVRNCSSNPSVRKEIIAELLALIHAERSDLESAKKELKEYHGRYENLFGGITTQKMGLIRTFEGHNSDINSVSLSADGKYALSGSADMTLKLWDVSTGQCLRIFEGHNSDINSVSLSADGKYAISGNDKTLKLWEVSTGQCLRTFEGHSSKVSSAILSCDGSYAISASRGNTLKLWDVPTGQCLRIFEGHSGNVYSVSLSADGKYAISGGKDKTLKLWEVSSGQCLRTFEGHRNYVVSVSLSADGKYALSGSYDNTLKLWEVSTGQCLRTFEGHSRDVNSVSLSAEGRYALSGSWDKTLKLWEINIKAHSYNSEFQVSDFKAFKTIKGIQDDLRLAIDEAHRMMNNGNNAQAFTTLYIAWERADFRDNKELLTVYQNLYELSSRKSFSFAYAENSFEGHSGNVNSVSLSADGKYALSGSHDKTLKLWDVSTGQCLRTFEGYSGDVNFVSLSADGKYALSGSHDDTLKLWEVSTGKCVRTFEGHSGNVNSVSLSADGKYALSGSHDKTLKLWEVSTGKCLRTFEGHSGIVWSVSLSADGKYALSGSDDDTFRLWEVPTGQCLHNFAGHSDSVTFVNLSANGRYALSWSRDKKLKLWDVLTGHCLRTFEQRIENFSSICLSTDYSFAISGSYDGTLNLWRFIWKLEFD